MTVYKTIAALRTAEAHLFDSNEENVSKYFYDSFFCSTPLSDEEQYENELFAYCRKHQIDLIVPATAYDLFFLSQRKQVFLEDLNCKIAVPDQEHLTVFLDKSKAYFFLSERGFPVQQHENPLSTHAFPLIGKPNRGGGGKGIVVINNRDDLHAGHYNYSDYLWTAHVERFKEYSIDFAVNDRGQVSTPVCRERLSVSLGIALVTESVELAGSFASLIKDTFCNTGMSGFYNLQFISTPECEYFTDLNPRIGTSAVVGDYFHNNLIAHFLGLPQKNDPMTGPLKVIRYLEEKFITTGLQPVINKTGDDLGDNYSIGETSKNKAREEGASQKELEIASNMVKAGYSISEIVQIISLTAEDIEKL